MRALWLRTTLRKTTPRASKSDAGGLGEVWASTHTPTERVHGEGLLESISINALRLRFRLVVSDFPGIVYILDGDRYGAVELAKCTTLPQCLPADFSASTHPA